MLIMNKMVKKLLMAPITILSIIFMIIGAVGVGYSFVTLVLNHNYIETEAEVVEFTDDVGNSKIVLEYKVGDETYQGNYPFLEKKLGQKVVVGYNPKNPVLFQKGGLYTHFTRLIWSSFIGMLGLVTKSLMNQLK